ncbi:PiggyBac transposable element-derived protein 4 [Trichinella papuae]|uniref:PiggyBac transposable element-derived protein 4 n=1 Tax=Trichinella papuae TaxID=268474 RepID=A0A0V1MFY1_9BILA|nr:PiggyBac transposable element-derived protein 4 [Trichinella papuae]
MSVYDFMSEEELNSDFDTETISDDEDILLSDFCESSSDESDGETSHTGDHYVSRDGTTWTTEPPAASRRRATCNILSTAPGLTARSRNIVTGCVQLHILKLNTGLTLVQKKLRHFLGSYSLLEFVGGKRNLPSSCGVQTDWNFNDRFDDTRTRQERKKTVKAAAVSEVFDTFVKNCKASYVPHGEVCVDEHLMSFRGRCPFRVYMKSKPDRYGVKMWMLCDVRTGYIWCVQIYTGKIGQNQEREQGKQVVLDLASDLGPVYGITTDNFFTSLDLARALLPQKKTLLGTIRQRCKEVPKELWPKPEQSIRHCSCTWTRC